MDDVICRQAVIEACDRIRCELQMLDNTQDADKMMRGLRLAEIAINKLPSADTVYRDTLIENILHYGQYSDGMTRLLNVYKGKESKKES